MISIKKIDCGYKRKDDIMKKFISFILAIAMLMAFNVTCFAAEKVVSETATTLSAKSGRLYYDSGVSSTGAYTGEFYAAQGGDTVFIYAVGGTSNKVVIQVADKATGTLIIDDYVPGDKKVYTVHKKVKAGHTYTISMYTAGTFAYVLNFYQN